MGCVYKFTSPSNKNYIGKTIDLKGRIYNYKTLNCKLQVKLYNSFKKYGYDNHKFEIVFESENEIELGLKEIELIKKCNSFKKGLNMTLGGEGFSGRTHSIFTKEKISISKTGTKLSEEHKKKIGLKMLGNNWNLGKKLTEEHKKNIGLKSIGRTYVMLESTKQKISNSKIGFIYKSGYKLSEKHKESHLKAMQKRGKPLEVLNSDGILIGKFNNLTEASKSLKMPRGQISNYCTKRYKNSNGLQFNYK